MTIVFIIPGMKESWKSEREQWILWEVSFSLRATTRKKQNGDTYSSNPNAMLAIVLPNANSPYDYFLEKKSCCSKGCQHGDISTLPNVPGILLFKSGHVSVYVGGGYAVEAQGFAYGVVKTKVSKRPWKEWAYLPSSMLTYDGSAVVVPDTDEQPSVFTVYKLGDRTLKRTLICGAFPRSCLAQVESGKKLPI